MMASWLTVDQASTRFRSSAAKAKHAAPNMVTTAIPASTSIATSETANSGNSLATR